MASDNPSDRPYTDDEIDAFYDRLFQTFPNGRYLRPLRGFPSAAYFRRVELYQRMSREGEGSPLLDHSAPEPMESIPDNLEDSMEDCRIVRRINVGAGHVRLLFHRQAMIILYRITRQSIFIEII